MAEGVCVKTSLLVCVVCMCVSQLAQGQPLRRRSISEVQLMHNVRQHQQVSDRQDWLQLKLNNILTPTHTHTQAQPSPSHTHTQAQASPSHTHTQAQASPSHTHSSPSNAQPRASHTQSRVLPPGDKKAKNKRRTLSSLDTPLRSRSTKTLDTPIRRADTPIRIRNTSLKTLNTPLATSPNNTLRTLKTVHTPLTRPDQAHTPLTSLSNKKAGHLPKNTQQDSEDP
ncbi:parathyroid hormone 1b [Engraulis encrasicolus]|uniref:parathyroid hormone 1b n=1 Tax=Engraulis encrasicolus TaxID=184585 RepID=UPI002FCEAE6C